VVERQLVGPAKLPDDGAGTRLGSGEREDVWVSIDPNHARTGLGQRDRQRTGAAPDIRDLQRPVGLRAGEHLLG